MTKRIALIAGVIIIIITVVLFGRVYKNESTRRPVYTMQVFKFQDGWGYDILKNNSVFIHQEYIPVIEVNTMFPGRRPAERTARLVLKKIKENKTPRVSRKELIELRIIKEQ